MCTIGDSILTELVKTYSIGPYCTFFKNWKYWSVKINFRDANLNKLYNRRY